MAVIDELVARLGFDVTGLPKVQAAAKAFEATKNSVAANAAAMNATAPAAAVAAAAVGKVGSESKKSSRSVLLMSTAMTKLRRGAVVMRGVMRAVLVALAAIAATALKVVGGIAAVGAAFVVAGVRAAKARREFQLAAKGIGTSAQNLETVVNGLRYVGLGDDAQKDAEKTVGAINTILKTIRAGGDEAAETQKKFKGLGIDSSLKMNPKTGEMRDASAVLLDMVQAYKQLQEQAAGYRKQADAIEKKNPRQAKRLRDRAIERDRKGEKLADEAGFEGKLKVLIDELSWPEFKKRFDRSARERPTTSNAQEERSKRVAEMANEAGQKFGALIDATKDRLLQIGMVLSEYVLPPLNRLLDKLIDWAKYFNLIPKTAGESQQEASESRLQNMAEGRRAERTLNPNPPDTRTDDEVSAAARRSEERFRQSVEEAAANRRNRRRADQGLPPAEPAKPGEPGKPGISAEPAKPGERGPPGAAAEPTVIRVPEPAALTPTQVIRETQADYPARLEAFRRRIEERRREKPTVPARDQGASADDWRKKASAGSDLLKSKGLTADLQVTPEASSFLQGFRDIIGTIPGIMSQISPETNMRKMEQAAQTKTENDNRTYSDIGNDKRTQNVTVNQTLQQDAAAVAAAARSAVLGAISTKGSNTSTGALTAP